MTAPPSIEQTEPSRRTASQALLIVALVLFGGWAILKLLPTIQQAFFLIFLAIVFAVILRFPIDFMSRALPRALATLITLVLVLGVVSGMSVLTVPVVAQQAQALIEQTPRAIDTLTGWWQRITGSNGALGMLGAQDLVAGLHKQFEAETTKLFSRLLPAAFGTASALLTAILVLALSTFIAHSPDTYVRGMLWLTPRRHEGDVRDVLHAMGKALRGWTLGTLISMAFVGALTAIGVSVIGIESWLLLGMLAFFADFIPFAGPFLVGIAIVIMGFAVSPSTGLWALVVYLVIQQLESMLIQPLVMKRAVKLAPAVLLIAQVMMFGAFGFLGLLIATPLFACAQVAIQVAYIDKALGRHQEPEV